MTFSIVASARYIWWRCTHTMDLNGGAEMFFGTGLVAAEFYAWLILLLGYCPEPPAAASASRCRCPTTARSWPTVDVFIPTYNEPLRRGARHGAGGARRIDWPRDKLHVYILDDGRREEFREFAAKRGVGYMIRDATTSTPRPATSTTRSTHHRRRVRRHLRLRPRPDAHVPADDGGLVPARPQAGACCRRRTTSIRPIRSSATSARSARVPNEGELFYGLVQDGNDFWNATFFCGSCAVLRRTALDEIGGIAVETVTEDAHTSLAAPRGWDTAYLNIPQAAGLATETPVGATSASAFAGRAA